MGSPPEKLGALLDYSLVVVNFTDSRLSVRCFRNTDETLKDCARVASDFTVNVNNQDVHLVVRTTDVVNIERSGRTCSNVDPLRAREILTLSILISYRRNGYVGGVSVSNDIVSSKLDATRIETNIKTTLNTTCCNSSSVGALSDDIIFSNDTSNATSGKLDLKDLIASIPCYNIDCFVRSTNTNSGRSARSEAADYSVNGEFQGILVNSTSSTRCSSNCFVSNEFVLVTRTRSGEYKDLIRTSVSYENANGVTESACITRSPFPGVGVAVFVSGFVVLKILDQDRSACINSILQSIIRNTDTLKDTTI